MAAKHSPLSHLLVVSQLTGVFLSIFPAGWQNYGHPFWLLLCAAGAVTGLFTLYHNKIGNFSVYPEIKPRARLITSGPYRQVRHPMYTAFWLWAFAQPCLLSNWLAGFPGIIGFGTLFVMRGFGITAGTHTIYNILVMSLGVL